MALIKCSECGKEISNQAAACPNCGMPIQQTTGAPAPVSPHDDDLLHCPKCNSTNLHVDKKGFSGGKALAGAFVAGGIGILAGTIESHDIDVTCLKCGHKFNPVKALKKKQEIEQKREMDEAFTKDMQANPASAILFFVAFICIILGIATLLMSDISNWWALFWVIIAVLGFISSLSVRNNK